MGITYLLSSSPTQLQFSSLLQGISPNFLLLHFNKSKLLLLLMLSLSYLLLSYSLVSLQISVYLKTSYLGAQPSDRSLAGENSAFLGGWGMKNLDEVPSVILIFLAAGGGEGGEGGVICWPLILSPPWRVTLPCSEPSTSEFPPSIFSGAPSPEFSPCAVSASPTGPSSLETSLSPPSLSASDPYSTSLLSVSIGGGGKGGGRISGSFPFSLEVSLQDNSVSIVSAGSFWLVRCRQPTPSFLRFFSNQLPFNFPHSELWQDEDFLQSGNDASQFSLVLAPISERK